jgi:DNA-binding FadR family transcriptional regulator
VTIETRPFTGAVRAPKTAEIIASQIRRQIVRKELTPGMSLPNEAELMSQFKVSRPTLREAYRILEVESLIEVRRGVNGGARVLSPSISVGARHVGLLLQLDDATITDVYDARMALEPVCAGMMAARGDEVTNAGLFDCVVEVEAVIAAGRDGIPEPRAWQAATYRFHDLVLLGSGNKTLALQGRLLQEVVATHYAATITTSFDSSTRSSRFHRVVSSFDKLATLVAAGDREGAEHHWRTHMEVAARALLGDDIKNKRIVDLFS